MQLRYLIAAAAITLAGICHAQTPVPDDPSNLAADAVYAYFDRAPGEGPYYQDDYLSLHPASDESLGIGGGLGLYSFGDLNDGILQDGVFEATYIPSPVVSFTDRHEQHLGRIIFDLGLVANIERVDLGTHRFTDWGNTRPEYVLLSFSETGDLPVDFGDTLEWDVPTNTSDGRATYSIGIAPSISARFVQFDFPTLLNPEEVHMDEIWIFGSTAANLECLGFEPPLASGAVKVKGNRALPLKAQISDASGYALTDNDLSAPPVLQVWFEYGTADAADVSDESLPAGQGDEGNQFVFTDDFKWQFNLKTANYTSPGTYTVLMESGDETEYVFDPTCMAEFVVK